MSDTNYKRIAGFIGILVLSAGIWASYHVPGSMPRLTAELVFDDGIVVQQGTTPMTTTGQELEAGDRIQSLNSLPVHFVEQLNFLLDGLDISDTVELVVDRKGQQLSLRPPLESAVSGLFLATNIVVGCLFWLFGMMVLVFGRIDRNAVLFFSMSMALSLVILVY